MNSRNRAPGTVPSRGSSGGVRGTPGQTNKALTGFQGGGLISIFNNLQGIRPRLAVNLPPFSAIDARKRRKSISGQAAYLCYLPDFTIFSTTLESSKSLVLLWLAAAAPVFWTVG